MKKPLPKLYEKFATDRQKMILLLQIPRYFDLESYTLNRGEKHLDDLLVQVGLRKKMKKVEIVQVSSTTPDFLPWFRVKDRYSGTFLLKFFGDS